MRILVTVLVVSSLMLTGCSRLRDSRANPANWFGKSTSRPVAETQAGQNNPLIEEETGIFSRRKKAKVYTGTPVDQITSLSVEKTSEGAIISVIGLSQLQGAYNVKLTSDTDGEPVNGVLTYTLKAVQPQDQPQGAQRSRTIHAARFVSNGTLEKVTTINVRAARNVQTTRR
ncbi:hypothetical protein PEL8287_03434 [Roseovarius litorisediminis]|uniref:Lipoprotein n=1 Tax=Roseovarius litorisediminis TaxID=1312363 RepID=A0A1Y5TIH0_9RHOB|nr:hypothetical protein [Roseovarius litorisediminis]SLN62736.1 hypothetical protein PEL8287_03434 [Roseovarius litorisediminis]